MTPKIAPPTLQEVHRVLKPGGLLFISSLCSPPFDSNFPKNFNSESRILTEGEMPYRYVPTVTPLKEEMSKEGFEILQKVERQDRPFGHVNIHARGLNNDSCLENFIGNFPSLEARKSSAPKSLGNSAFFQHPNESRYGSHSRNVKEQTRCAAAALLQPDSYVLDFVVKTNTTGLDKRPKQSPTFQLPK